MIETTHIFQKWVVSEVNWEIVEEVGMLRGCGEESS